MTSAKKNTLSEYFINIEIAMIYARRSDGYSLLFVANRKKYSLLPFLRLPISRQLQEILINEETVKIEGKVEKIEKNKEIYKFLKKLC
jgi:hypothetical protein